MRRWCLIEIFFLMLCLGSMTRKWRRFSDGSRKLESRRHQTGGGAGTCFGQIWSALYHATRRWLRDASSFEDRPLKSSADSTQPFAPEKMPIWGDGYAMQVTPSYSILASSRDQLPTTESLKFWNVTPDGTVRTGWEFGIIYARLITP